jgi:hypothetical protein
MDNSAAGFSLLIFFDICAMNIPTAGPAPLMSPNFTQVTPGTSQQVATYGPVLLGTGSKMGIFAAHRTYGSTAAAWFELVPLTCCAKRGLRCWGRAWQRCCHMIKSQTAAAYACHRLYPAGSFMRLPQLMEAIAALDVWIHIIPHS